MGVKFSKNVEWLKPFYEAAEDLLPQGKLTAVKGYTIPLWKDTQGLAACHSEKGKRSVNITLWVESDFIKNGRVKKRRPRYIEDVLMIFAHELAHVPQKFYDEYHPPSHFELTVKILARFGKVLKKKKVKDTTARRCKALGKKG